MVDGVTGLPSLVPLWTDNAAAVGFVPSGLRSVRAVIGETLRARSTPVCRRLQHGRVAVPAGCWSTAPAWSGCHLTSSDSELPVLLDPWEVDRRVECVRSAERTLTVAVGTAGPLNGMRKEFRLIAERPRMIRGVPKRCTNGHGSQPEIPTKE